MSQVMFSDDDDVVRHAADLEQIHESITARETYSPSPCASDGKENHSSCSYFDKDPVYRSILEERKSRRFDVFISPLAPPSKSCDVYEFSSDHDSCNEKTDVADCSTSRPTSSTSHQSVHSESDTPRISRYRKYRLKKLRDAISTACASASDGDEEFVPPLRDLDPSPGEEETPRMKLRARKELWSPDDELSLADVQLQIVIAESAAEALESRTCRRTPEQELSSENRVCDVDDEDDFAFLPSSRQCTPKNKRKRGVSASGTPNTCAKKESNNHNSGCRLRSSRAVNRHSKRERDDSRDEMDLPLADFVTSSSGACKRRRTSRLSRCRRTSNSAEDEDYKGSDTEVPLSEIRNRYSSMRRGRSVKRRRIDYSVL